MDKKQKILLLIIGILVIMAVVIGILAFKKEKNNPDHNKVNKFKEEYEVINGTTDKKGYTYPTVEIDVDSDVEYIDINKAIELIDNDDVAIYIGNSTDFDSRNVINSLLSAIDSSGMGKLYYIDSKAFEDNNSEDYLQLLERLDSILNKDEVEDEDGNKVGTIKKELYIPTVIITSQGEIIDYHVGTVESHMKDDDKKRELTKDEQEELFNIYIDMFLKVSNSACDESTGC